MYRFFQIFKMDLSNNFKNPVLINFNSVFAIVMILIMGFLTSGNYANAMDAYNYYAVSFLIFGMMEGAMTATNCFMERDIKKPNLRILSSPCGKFPIYFSKIFASFLFDYILHLLVAVILLIAGINLGGQNMGWIFLMMIPVEFSSAALGVLFCCIFHCEETASTILSLFVSVIAFLGGAFFSLDGLGSTLAAISRISPVKMLIDVFFAVIYDNNLSGVLPVLFISTAFSALCIFGCQKTFRAEDYL
jgi:ABC-2 type transport system permease protein